LTNPSGNASRGGFQILALDAQNTQGGSWANESAGASLKNVAGKTYLGHQGSQSFPASNELNWSGEWTSPDETDATFDFYAVSIIANGGQGNQNDRFLLQQFEATIEAVSTPLSATVTLVSDETCAGANDGSATVTITGGAAPYEVLWENGETTLTATMLPAGNAFVVVTDDNGETTEAELVINTTGADINVGIVNQTDVTCFGSADGSVTVEATGGVAPYDYIWSDGTVGPTLTDVESAPYNVIVTDANGCMTDQNVFISSPAEIVITQILTDPLCNGDVNGFIILDVVGGTSPYSFLWENGSQSNSQFNIAAGVYLTTVTDDNGCETIVSSELVEPNVLDASVATISNPTCNGDNNGSIEVTPAGGNPDFTYEWNTGATTGTITDLSEGTYIVTVTDSKSCSDTAEFVLVDQTEINISTSSTPESNPGASDGSATVANIFGGVGPFTYLWSTGAVTETITNLSSGSYTVTVFDTNGCSGEGLAAVPAGDCMLLASVELANVSCNGAGDGMAVITVENSTDPISYLWSDGSTEGNRSDLSPDTYQVIILDSAGCADTISNIVITEPEVLTATADLISANPCGDGSNGILQAIGVGGTPEYSYLWSHGDTLALADSLPETDYFVTITDANGCTATASNFISSFDEELPTLILQDLEVYAGEQGFDPVDALEFDDGSVDNCSVVNFTYVTPPVINCDSLGITQIVSIQGTDAFNNADTLEASITLLDTLAPVLTNEYNGIVWSCDTLFFDLPFSVDNCTDSVIITQTEGLPSGSVFPVGITQQSFLFEDSSGNSVGFSFPVEIISDLSVEGMATDVACFGDSTGVITVDVLGMHTPSLEDSTLVQDMLPAGDYEIVVSDTVGCVVTTNVTIEQPEEITALISSTPAEGNNTTDGEIVVTASGGTLPYIITLFSESGEEIATSETGIFSELAPGTYSISLTDANDCDFSTEEITVEFITNTSDLLEVFDLTTYPNPVRHQLNIDFDGKGQALAIRLMTVEGKVIWSSIAKESIIVDMSTYNSGLYLLSITDQEYTATRKIHLQK